MEWKFRNLMGCLHTCGDQACPSRLLNCRIWNHTEKPIDLQIRVGSILKKVHTLRPGRSKRLKFKSIYREYLPRGGTNGGRGGVFTRSLYSDETCQPYIWVHDSAGNFSRTVRQQYISLADLRNFSDIRVFRDHQRGWIKVHKKPRQDHYYC